MMVATIGEILEDMRNGVCDYTEDGKCTQCGNCCSNILPIAKSEVERIRKYIKKNHIKEQKHTYPAPLAIPPSFDLTCPFMDESKSKNKCAIYPVRPLVCACFNCHDLDVSRSDPNLYSERRIPIDVRETFFGK